MKLKLLILFFTLFCLSLTAQVRPDQQAIQPTITDSLATYGQESGTLEKYLFIDQKGYILQDTTTVLTTITALIDTLAAFRDTLTAGGGISYLIQSSAPSDTQKKWIDRSTWDSTSVFEVKEYILTQGWKTTGWIDTVNYTFSSQPPIYIVATGQSNITPRANATTNDTLASLYTTIWDGDLNKWTKLHTDKSWMNGTTNKSAWCVLTFGKEAAEKDGRIVKIVYTALGGQAIANWISPTGTQWDTLSTRIAASGIPQIDGVIWYQGETDGWTGRTASQYKADWYTVMAQFQALPEWHAATKVLAVQLNTGEIPATPDGETANTIFNYFANDAVEWTYVIKNDDAVVVSDSSHIDADAHITLGQRLWHTFTETKYNPLQRYGRSIITTDSVSVDFNNSVVTFNTLNGSSTYINDFKNHQDGWTGFLRVINSGVSIIPPNGQMYCQTENGEIVEIDTILGKYMSVGYLQTDTLILNECPIGANFSIAPLLPIELGVFAWYDSEQEASFYSNGATATTLHDFSGNSIDIASSGSPTFSANAINGKPSITFNSGDSDYYTLADTTFSFLHYDSSTVIMLFKAGSDAVSNPDSLYGVMATQSDFGSSQKGFSIYYDDRSMFSNVDELTTLVSNGTNLAISQTAVTPATANQFNYVFIESDPANGTASLRSKIRVNDGVYSTGNVQANGVSITTQTPFNIGRATGATPYYLTGEIAEIMIFDKVLTTEEKNRIMSYLNRKYLLNLTLD